MTLPEGRRSVQTAVQVRGLGASFTGSAMTTMPEGLSLEFLNLQEFGATAIDEVSVHEEFVFSSFGENRRGLREALVRNNGVQSQGKKAFPHHQIQSLRSEDRSCSEVHRFHQPNPVEPHGILPEVADSWVAMDYSKQAKGVLDSGATKTVIGSKLVDDLLKSLDPEVRKCVTRSSCKVTFRFGNLSTLDAHHALVIPVGSLNLRVAIVPGSTPFLISNTLVRALKSVIDTHHHKLHSPSLKYPLSLELTERGLFLLDINELVKASSRVSTLSAQQDTFVTEDVQKDLESISAAVQSKHQDQAEKINHNHMLESTNSQDPCRAVDNKSKSSVASCPEPSAEVQESLLVQNVANPSLIDHVELASSTSQAASCRGSSGGGGRLESVLGPTIARHEDRLRQFPQGENIPSNVDRPPKLGPMDVVPLRSKQEAGTPPCDSLLLSGDRALRVDWTSGAIDRCTSQAEDDCRNSSEAQSQESCRTSTIVETQWQDRVGGGMGVAGPRDGPRGFDRPSGGESESRDCPVERSHESNGRDAEPNCSAPAEACLGFEPKAVDMTDLAWLTLHAGDSDSIESSQSTRSPLMSEDQKYFQKLVNQYTEELIDCKGSERIEKHMLFEVFCGKQSPLAQQCQNLRGKAQRFCRERGDLQTIEGRKDLFREIHRCQPDNIWVSPSCNPWCGFSTLNGSRSLQAWDDLQTNRRFHLEQVALCLVLTRFQVQHQRHLHWEQPRTSVMFRLPQLKELYMLSWWAAEFDMCQFGLQDPQSQAFIRKSMIVRTTSKRVFQAIHGRKCTKSHPHQTIEGSTIDKGIRVNRSQYTERYPRRFARTIVLAFPKHPLLKKFNRD